MKLKVTLICLLCALAVFSAWSVKDRGETSIPQDSKIDLSRIKLPDGFKISIFAEGITDARSLASTPDGKTIFVANRRRKNVYALTDTDGDHVADKTDIIVSNWRTPNGVAYKDGDLYVAQINKIHRFKDIMNNLSDPKSEVIYDGYPTDGHHGWKFIAFGA